MQDRYTGDIGDFAKYALLRALSPDSQLGVAWYLFPDESHNTDGRHTAYLSDAKRWRRLDAVLFDTLRRIVGAGDRGVAQIESSDLFNRATFCRTLLSFDRSHAHRSILRARWYRSMLRELEQCDLVFADPDNGLCVDAEYDMGSPQSWKRMPLSELHVLAAGRTAIVYHHNSRQSGGHTLEIQHWLKHLGPGTVALYWRVISPRTFFVVHPSPETLERIHAFAAVWSPHFELRTQSSADDQPLSRTAPAKKANESTAGGKRCPECGHAFSGSGWVGIDAHWKAKHENIMPYAEAWPLIRTGWKPSDRDDRNVKNH